jgi:DNA-binding CsgD family transcriptional regulator
MAPLMAGSTRTGVRPGETLQLTEILGRLGSFVVDWRRGTIAASEGLLRLLGLDPGDEGTSSHLASLAERVVTQRIGATLDLRDAWARLARLGPSTATMSLVRPDGRVRQVRITTAPLTALAAPGAREAAMAPAADGAVMCLVQDIDAAEPTAGRAGEPADIEATLRSVLSERELAVVRLVSAGLRPGAIARELYVSASTVRNHLSSSYRKLGVGSQVELARWLAAGGPDRGLDGALDGAGTGR